MPKSAVENEYRDQLIFPLYQHQQPEPIDPDEEEPPVEEPAEKPPVLPPDDVPERPAPVPPVREPGHPDLPGHIISRSCVIVGGRGAIGISLPEVNTERE